MSKIPVFCGECTKRFVIKQPNKKIHNDALEGKLMIYYISCPHCKKKTVSFVESEKLKTMIKENKTLQKSLGTITNEEEYIEVQDEFQHNVRKIETLTKDLIFRFSKYV